MITPLCYWNWRRKGGWGRGRHPIDNHAQSMKDSLHIRHYVRIRKPDHCISLFFQITRPHNVVVFAASVRITIKLNHQLWLIRSKIGDEFPDDLLSAKLDRAKPRRSQFIPHASLGLGHALAHILRVFQRVGVSHSPLPTLSPEGERARYSLPAARLR